MSARDRRTTTVDHLHWLSAIGITTLGIIIIIGSGGGGDSTPTGSTTPQTMGTISGTVAGTEIIAVNDSGNIVASDDTIGKTPNGNGNYPFSLSGIPVNTKIQVLLITGNGIFPMYFDSDSNGTPDTNVFTITAAIDIALGFIDTAVAGQEGKAIPANNPTDIAGVNAGSANASIPVTASIIGTWGYGRLKHRNSGSWAAQSGVFIYHADGTGSSSWDENDNNALSSKSFNWTWTASTNPDGSTTLIRTFPDTSIKTRRIVISDDNKVMILDGTDQLDRQRFRIGVRMNPSKTYTDTDLSGDYYNIEYTRDDSMNHRTFSSVTSSDGAGNLSQTYTANDNGTVSTGVENHTYAVSTDGSVAVDGMSPSFYLSTNGKLLTGAPSTTSNIWSVPLLMKKADRVYNTADLAGTWAFVVFGDGGGTSFFSEIGTMICDSSGICTSDFKQQRDGSVVIGTNPASTSTVQADGSIGESLGPNTPSYAGAIGNDGNTFLANPSFEDPTGRVIIIGVKCSTCSQLASGGGPGLTRLTDDSGDDGHPYFSPSGSQIAFHSDRSGNNDIWIMNADGSNPTQITTHAASDRRPDWSPDGSRLVFHSNRSGNEDIWIMNANGSGLTQLTTHSGSDSHPAWSPDGTRIAFQSNRAGNNDVWLINPDGSGLTQLTTATSNEGHPMWKPDGTQIAFSHNLGSNDIWIMNADGSNQQALTNNPADEQHPAWSPDGSQIAFRSDKVGNYDVWVMDADGSNQQQITTYPSNDRNPDWSPDGTQLLFRSDRTGNQDIWSYTLP